MKSFNLIMVAIITLATIFFIPSVSAQTSKSEWVETAIVDIPQDYPIHEGVTKNNTPKYWITIEGVKISISPTNYTKFINKEVGLVVVEWYNATKNTYRYTTRQKAVTKKLNLQLQ